MRPGGAGGGGDGQPGQGLEEGAPLGLDLVGEAVLEAAARAVEAESERGEGAAERRTRLRLLGLGEVRGGGEGAPLFGTVGRFGAGVAALDVQEVATGAEGAYPEGAEGAAGDVPAAPVRLALLGGAVDEQAAAAVVAVASGVVAPAQLRFVFRVVERDVQLVEAVGELAAFAVLAEAGGRVAGAELGLVTGGTDPGDPRRRGGLGLGKEGLGQGDSFTLRLLVG